MIAFVVLLFGLFLSASLSSAQTYLHYKDFEEGSVTSGINTLASCCENGDSQGIVNSPVRYGTKAIRITADPTVTTTDSRRRTEPVVPNWVWTNGQLVRAELVKYDLTPGTGNYEAWYGFSVYIPSTWNDTSSDPNGTVITQWHHSASSPDCSTNSPQLSIRILPSEVWRISNISDPCNGTGFTNTRTNHGSVAKDVWTDWVVYAKWSHTTSGILKIWKNGTLIVDRTGPNGKNTDGLLGHRLSIYKGWWSNDSNARGRPPLTAYFDEWRITDFTGSYNAVAPRHNGSLPLLQGPSNLVVSQ